jgi:pimeloyl-ACP methyl ester carboxylesterase
MSKLIKILALLIFALVCFGLINENLNKQQALIDYPPKGKLIDIGGRKMHLDCRGSGSPTVVFESGLDTSGSLSWSLVHDEIAKTTRACAYDRAGMMWSDPRPDTDNVGKAIADDLNATLTTAGEHGPFVMVGHSFGGPYITIFTKYYGDKVAGLVLVDTSHPEQVERMKDLAQEHWFDTATYAVMDFFEPAWSIVGLTRVFAKRNTAKEPNQSDYDAQAIDAYSPISGESHTVESHDYTHTLAQANQFLDFGDRPLIAIGAIANFDETSDEELEEYGLTRADVAAVIKRQVIMHNEQATWSSNGKLILLYDTPHYIQFAKPQIVIDAVGEVVGDVRRE